MLREVGLTYEGFRELETVLVVETNIIFPDLEYVAECLGKIYCMLVSLLFKIPMIADHPSEYHDEQDIVLRVFLIF